jgi:type II secretory pathway component PulK
MNRRSARRRRGVALLLVLGLIVMVGAATAALATTARAATDEALGIRARATARSMAESGITAGALALQAMMQSGDSMALNAIDGTDGRALASDTLDDGAFVVAAQDPASQLDLNRAEFEAIATLFGRVLPPTDARRVAEVIEQRRQPVPGLRVQRAALRDVSELRTLPGMTAAAFGRLVPFVTVDGDGSVNRVTASAPVQAVATGSLTGTPTRMVLIARGWHIGHPLTHEITAVFDVTTPEPRMIQWRERDL